MIIDYINSLELLYQDLNSLSKNELEQIILLYQEYKQKKRKKTKITFKILSKDPYIINFINQIAKKYVLLKENNIYHCMKKDLKESSIIHLEEELKKYFKDQNNKYDFNYKFLE